MFISPQLQNVRKLELVTPQYQVSGFHSEESLFLMKAKTYHFYSKKNAKNLYFKSEKFKPWFKYQTASTYIHTPEALQVVDQKSLQQLLPSCFMGAVSNKHGFGCYSTAVKIKGNVYDYNKIMWLVVQAGREILAFYFNLGLNKTTSKK